MATIRDVAEKAGVSTMTVSRVINNSGYVSDKTRAKIESVIEELGYIPNMLGQSLRFNQTNTLALVITDITNPFWTTVSRGVEDAAQEKGYSIILCNTDESVKKQDQYLTMLLKRRIDGILLAPTSSSADGVHRITKLGIKVVVLDRDVPNVNVDIVLGDSFGGSVQLTKYLLELGHKHIAMVAGPRDVSTSTERVAGYEHAMQAAGLETGNGRIFWGKFSRASGYANAQKALAQHPQPTAMFAANNFIAVGVLQAVREAGLRIPEDVSIVAFGDIPESINPEPFFTVATHPTYEMGYQATQILLSRIKEEGATQIQKIVLPIEIIPRGSTASPP
ncbi:MAG: LacI family transcriptional regulator [Chloroflexi bacterium]|nr:MAG: LacI family transcriptional regulator [Chloroflexota bacterium]